MISQSQSSSQPRESLCDTCTRGARLRSPFACPRAAQSRLASASQGLRRCHAQPG